VKNEGMVPYISNYLTANELSQLAALLDKVAQGYRQFYNLPVFGGEEKLGPPADTIPAEEWAEGAYDLTPVTRIAFLEDLRNDCWTAADDAHDREQNTGEDHSP